LSSVLNDINDLSRSQISVCQQLQGETVITRSHGCVMRSGCARARRTRTVTKASLGSRPARPVRHIEEVIRTIAVSEILSNVKPQR
jgi:hypothetical protein